MVTLMFKIIGWAISLLTIIQAQIVDYVRDQPFPIKASEVRGCCPYLSHEDLFNSKNLAKFSSCLNRTSIMAHPNENNTPGIHDSHTQTVSSQVVLVTYAAPGTGYFGIQDITSFSSYQNGMMAVYAEHNNYQMRVLGPETGSNYQPDDVRWNKVKILMEALNKEGKGWASHADYIVWMDADAIILDIGILNTM
jgi:hypothetical protein